MILGRCVLVDVLTWGSGTPVFLWRCPKSLVQNKSPWVGAGGLAWLPKSERTTGLSGSLPRELKVPYLSRAALYMIFFFWVWI